MRFKEEVARGGSWTFLAGMAASVLLGFGQASPASAASATALVTVRVLGHAEAEVAQGAVTVSNITGASRTIQLGSPAPSGRAVRADARDLATFRIGGAYNATFAVSLPQQVTVRSGEAELNVSQFRTRGDSGRLAADGTATVGIDASVTIPSGQSSGAYAGSYAVNIAYN